MERKNKLVREYFFKHNDDFPPDDAIGCVEWFNKKLAEIPEECRIGAEIEINGNDYQLEIVISYARPETDEEMQHRIAENVRLALNKEAIERKQYEALKAKFDPS